MTLPAYAQDLNALRGKCASYHDSSSQLDTSWSASAQSVRTTTTDNFTVAAKLMMGGDHPLNQCWACDGSASHHCHVIAKEDSQVRASCLFLLFYTNPRVLGQKVGAGRCFASWL